MKDTYSRGYKAAALVLLLIELAVLCLPVFGGSTAFLLLKGFWQHGNQLQHIAAPLLLLICPAISLFLLLKIQTSRTADTTDKFVEDLLPHIENTPADCGTLFFLSGPLTNQSFPLPAYTNVFLGRSSQLCQIVVNTADISRKHICLCYHAAQHTFVITDYSANGTYNTDGERLIANTSIEVPDGSVFYIGNKQTSFRLSA